MVIFHGNSRQWWPKLPWFSLKNEGVAEHTNLLFNTLAVVTAGQALIGRLPQARWRGRAAALAVVPAALPALIGLGDMFGLEGKAAEAYHLGLVPVLPVAAMIIEEALAG